MTASNGHILPPYISHVHLKGYKSILDTSVDLYAGLNIIIGPNGSGKTNFLEFLIKTLYLDLPKSDFHTHLKIVHNGKINIWETEPNFEPRYLQVPNKERPISIWIYAKGEKNPAPDIHYLFNGEYRNSFVNQKRFDVMQFMRITFIKFSLPKVLAGLTSHLTITCYSKVTS